MPGPFYFMKRLATFTCLLAILVTAGALRWTGLDWDDYHHYHPDERYISWVATTVEWPAAWSGALRPYSSTFNPFYWPAEKLTEGIQVPQDEPRDFAYGHLPLYLGVAATRLAERVAPWAIDQLPANWLLTRDIFNAAEQNEYRHLTAVARALTGLFDIGTVLLVFLLGRRLFETAVGLIAAAFLALNVMHIQLSHFFISDPYQSFFVVATITCLIMAVGPDKERAPRAGGWLWLAAVMTGLAVGSKFSAIYLLLPLALTVWAVWPQRWSTGLAGLIITAVLTFFLTNPFAILDQSCEVLTTEVQIGPLTVPPFDLNSCYLDNISTQSSMVRGDADIPFTRQYRDTLPYLYHIEMQLKWGMGPLLGVVAFAGLLWSVVWLAGPLLRWSRRLWTSTMDQLAERSAELQRLILRYPLLIVLAWCVPFWLTTGAFTVKFMRYLLPLTPFLMVLAAAWLWRWPRPFWRALAIGVVLGGTAVYALAFVNLYRQPHPWIVASGWIYTNVPEDSLILSEQWDDTLPTSLTVNGCYRRRAEFNNAELTWLTRADNRDDLAKLEQNLAELARADYLVLTSNRVYGVVPAQPDRFPISSQYYPLLFSGALGFEPVFVYERTPQLFGLDVRSETFAAGGLTPPPLVAEYINRPGAISLGRADESFTVYDHPLTIIFQKKRVLSAAEMRDLFELPVEE